MERGYIKLYRCVADNDLWLEKPFDKARAWIDLLLLANHRDSVVYKRGIRIEVPRGAVAWSERQLSDRWGWSRTKIRLFFEQLKKDHQIIPQKEPQNSNITSLIYLINYEHYQTEEPQKEPQKRPQKDHRKTAKDTMDNNEKNEKNKNIYNSLIEKPESVDEQVWSDWCKIRHTKKATITQTAINGITKQAELAGYTLNEALSICCERNWQGFKADWVEKKTIKTEQRSAFDSEEKMAALIRQVEEADKW